MVPRGGSPLVSDLAFPDASPYAEVPAGTYTLDVNAAGTDDTVLTVPDATLASGGDKTLVAWYEDSRLKLMEIKRDGLGKPSILARVNGFQPDPDLTRGEKPGQWLVAFRDYESARFEAFGLRTECQ